MVRSVEQNNTKADTKGDHANEVIKIPKKKTNEKEKKVADLNMAL